jgi:hypothetical protein
MSVLLFSSGTFPAEVEISISGPPYSETNNCPRSLPHGASCRIEVTFTPRAVGTFKGKISISDSRNGAMLSGTGELK